MLATRAPSVARRLALRTRHPVLSLFPPLPLFCFVFIVPTCGPALVVQVACGKRYWRGAPAPVARMATSWDGLGKDARRLEADIDAKLAAFGRATAALSSIRSTALGGPASGVSTATSLGDGEFFARPRVPVSAGLRRALLRLRWELLRWRQRGAASGAASSDLYGWAWFLLVAAVILT